MEDRREDKKLNQHLDLEYLPNWAHTNPKIYPCEEFHIFGLLTSRATNKTTSSYYQNIKFQAKTFVIGLVGWGEQGSSLGIIW